MPIIYRDDSEPPPPTPPTVKAEPLNRTVSTSITATDEARLLEALTVLGVSKAAFARAAVLGRLDEFSSEDK